MTKYNRLVLVVPQASTGLESRGLGTNGSETIPLSSGGSMIASTTWLGDASELGHIFYHRKLPRNPGAGPMVRFSGWILSSVLAGPDRPSFSNLRKDKDQWSPLQNRCKEW